MSVNDLINQAGEWDLEMVPDEGRVANRNTLVGKIFSERTISLRALRGMVRSAWVDNPKPKMQEMPNIQPLEDNTFVFDFEKKTEMEAIWSDRPCPISGTVMQLKKPSAFEDAKEVKFQTIEFWVQVHNLPEAYRSEGNISMMERMFHRVVDIDKAAIQAQIYRKFIRIFVEIDVSKSLPDGFYIRQKQKRSWVEYKYERLYSLCYFCGRIDHTKLECEMKRNCDENGLPYPQPEKWGPWTRANSPVFSPRTNQQVDVEKVLNRDTASASNSPVGLINPSSATTATGTSQNIYQGGPHALSFSPRPGQSPFSSNGHNFTLSTDLFQSPSYFSPTPQNHPPFQQNQEMIASPPQSLKVARNLFGDIPFYQSSQMTTTSNPFLPVGFANPNLSPTTYPAQANYIFNHNYFPQACTSAQKPRKFLSNEQRRGHNGSPGIQKKKRKASLVQMVEETGAAEEEQGKTRKGQAGEVLSEEDPRIPPGFEPENTVDMVADSKPPGEP
ncbi:unnamed protein product [Linum trigynum]|uniref:DUF4283 domain-containing protein n=1 Tax=Linum trigynum TaxID=586398 RepID=A0AAV2DN84_9ROSI